MNTVKITEAVNIIKQSKYTVAFTGAGISVESGVPPFRGENGLWNKYDPKLFYLDYFLNNQEVTWKVLKEVFYTFMENSFFNKAHEMLAILERNDLLKCVITQNIDNFHYDAGNRIVHEFHGNIKRLRCLYCNKVFQLSEIGIEKSVPACLHCKGLLKPDIIFFGESIPPDAYNASVKEAHKAEVMLIIGTTGEVMPACQIPHLAKRNGCKIIEVNTNPSNFTNSITDIYLQGKATDVLEKITTSILSNKNPSNNTIK
ncbi:NAD-dependent deacetylase [Bacteroidota bacterium]